MQDAVELRKGIDATTVDAATAPTAIALIDALRFLGQQPVDVTVQPWPLTQESEATVDALLIQAQDGVFANSPDILDYYADHLEGLVDSTLALPADSPLLLSRVSVITNQPEGLSATDIELLRDRVMKRRGCAESPNMFRIAEDPNSACELGQTRLALNSGFLPEENHDSAR